MTTLRSSWSMHIFFVCNKIFSPVACFVNSPEVTFQIVLVNYQQIACDQFQQLKCLIHTKNNLEFYIKFRSDIINAFVSWLCQTLHFYNLYIHSMTIKFLNWGHKNTQKDKYLLIPSLSVVPAHFRTTFTSLIQWIECPRKCFFLYHLQFSRRSLLDRWNSLESLPFHHSL
jgi:hypothetical protein